MNGRTFAAAILIGLGSLAQARQHSFIKKVDVQTLRRELEAAGFKVGAISCLAERCSVALDDAETRSPQAVIDAHLYVDRQKTWNQERAAIRTLLNKWTQGTITPQEKDDLIRRFIMLYLGE